MAESGKGVIGILGGDFEPRPRPARRPGHRRRRALDGDLRHRLRLLQDPERRHQGRHPLRRRRWRSPAWTSPRWVRSPTPSSSSPSSTADPEVGERPLVGSTGAASTRASPSPADRSIRLQRPGGHGSPCPPGPRSDRPRLTHRRMDIAEILRHILIVLVAAKVAAEVAERLGIPAVVGEIVAGILVGPSVLERDRPGRRGPAHPRRDRRDPAPARRRPRDGPRRARQGRPHVAAGRDRRRGRADGPRPRRHVG